MADKTTAQIDQIREVGIPNYKDTFVFIDSDEFNETFKGRFDNFITLLQGLYRPLGLKFTNGNPVCFTNGNTAKVSRGI